MQNRVNIGGLVAAALAGLAVLAATELILLFGILRVFAMLMGPELLPSLKIVFDMGALAAAGWTAGRINRPRSIAAAALTAAVLATLDLTPYLPLNVPWLLRLALNAASDSRFLSSFFTTLTLHAVLFGSLFVGAHLSRTRNAPMGLGVANPDAPLD